jgi:uracil-DNA glycosylase
VESLAALLERIRACTLCAEHLPHGPRPVVRAAASARILIAGQAPGRRVHASGLPFDDPSGDRLRAWMGVTREEFYDASRIAFVPMGFCYPGTGTGGDLPPRPECAPAWRAELLARLRRVELTLVIGSYAHAYHLGVRRSSVAQTVQSWRAHAPALLPLPHPSPRNVLWLRRHAWFEAELVPLLRARVREVLAG